MQTHAYQSIPRSLHQKSGRVSANIFEVVADRRKDELHPVSSLFWNSQTASGGQGGVLDSASVPKERGSWPINEQRLSTPRQAKYAGEECYVSALRRIERNGRRREKRRWNERHSEERKGNEDGVGATRNSQIELFVFLYPELSSRNLFRRYLERDHHPSKGSLRSTFACMRLRMKECTNALCGQQPRR